MPIVPKPAPAPDPAPAAPADPTPAPADAPPAPSADAPATPAKRTRKPKPEPAGPKYRIVHTMVGYHREGEIVTAADFPTGEDAVDRLLDLGAIEEVTDEAK